MRPGPPEAAGPRARIRAGIRDPVRKREYVKDLFGRIARRYDLTNDVMSLGLHRRWKRKVVGLAGVGPGYRVLDLAAGTGDLAATAARRLGATGEGSEEERPPRGAAPPRNGLVVAADLSLPMLRVGISRGRAGEVCWSACDAVALPFPDGFFDAVLVGYGLRNFADLGRSLAEIRRCLRPGGRLVALDFGKPASPTLRRAYLRYLDLSTRAVGRLLHGDPEAYLYIPESLRRFPGQAGVAALMRARGFVRCGYLELLWGTMAINFGDRPP